MRKKYGFLDDLEEEQTLSLNRNKQLERFPIKGCTLIDENANYTGFIKKEDEWMLISVNQEFSKHTKVNFL